jgi:hypothetical protein
VLEAPDHNGALGACSPTTRLDVIPVTGGNRGTTVEFKPDRPGTVPVPVGARELVLDITVINVRDDANCAVDISAASGELVN